MKHTQEYYESQIARRDKEIAQLRETLTFYVSTKKRDVGMELLRADRDRWKTIATAEAHRLLAEYQKAEASV